MNFKNEYPITVLGKMPIKLIEDVKRIAHFLTPYSQKANKKNYGGDLGN